MCRVVRGILVLGLAVFVARADADEIEAYLRQRSLNRLLMTHLETRLGAVTADEKAELILKLSTLYAELLETTSDPLEQAALEESSRRLLAQSAAAGTEELRLALLRNAYRRTEKVAEDHRLRLAEPAELDSTKRTLAEIIPQMNTLRKELKERVEGTNRRHARSSGTESITLGEAATKTQEQLSRCTFLTAWATYYQAWLNADRELARAAEPMFGELLSTETTMPQPSEISVDLRENEAVARSILGMGLCKSLSTSADAGLEWIGLLEEANTFEVVRAQTPVWRLVIHLEHGEYADVRDVLEKFRHSDEQIPLPWLRLIVVSALEDQGRTRLSSDMAKSMMAELASRGELEQVLDLANRYGTQALGETGFAAQYVQGIIAYQAARKNHASQEPLEANIVGQYDVAAQRLANAIGEPDASKYAAPRAACLRLIAWCRFFQSRFSVAKDSFLEAAKSLKGDEAAEATWMAIVSLDKMTSTTRNDKLQAELAGLIDDFVRNYPTSERTPQLILRQAATQPQAAEQSIDDLLAIRPDSAVYGQARRRAGDLLYQRFRGAAAEHKAERGHDFLNVAVPLISSAARAVDLADPQETTRHIARCRQILEVAFAEGVDRVQAGRAALDSLDRIREDTTADLTAYASEVACRRVQERLASLEPLEAGRLADELWVKNADDLWTRLGTRAMFRYGHDRWKDSQGEAAARKQGMDLVAKYGGRVLREFQDDPNGLEQAGSLAYHAAVAEATLQLWQGTQDAERGRAALFLFEKLLVAKPRNASFLRGTAVLAEKLDGPDRAMECWRKLVAGLPPQSDGWFEARFHLIRLLATADPARAREVMNQHKQLIPEYGPDPWGPQLKGLDEILPKEPITPMAPDVPGVADTTGDTR